MRNHRMVLGLLALLMALTGCGGSDSVDADAGSSNNGGNGTDELVIGGDLDLPDYFPSDFYLPDTVTIKTVSNDSAVNMMSLSGTYEGDGDAIRADMVSGLQAAGYELLNDDEDISVFIKDGVGRIRIRAREFLGEPTLTVDIDTWTDEQIAQLRDLNAEEITVTGRATAEYGGDTIEAEGECYLKGTKRTFVAGDVSISITVDETLDPVYVYADVTTPDGTVWTLDESAGSSYESSPQRFSASGQMVQFNNEDAGTISFSIEASCDA